ncbi:hypothetical protein L596_005518 [Steinernema carpocapsae]|uniref:Uncharacterized protein n=1 Tax=Steinernema carpocapsae TaxID=34508 RepID=A0A4U8V0G3_STECR|nr:hypothetical protein L596_005518 [Steinernema carpocapsae]
MQALFRPEKCVFEATEVSTEETEFLGSQGIETANVDSTTADQLSEPLSPMTKWKSAGCFTAILSAYLNDDVRSRWRNLQKTILVSIDLATSTTLSKSISNESLTNYEGPKMGQCGTRDLDYGIRRLQLKKQVSRFTFAWFHFS